MNVKLFEKINYILNNKDSSSTIINLGKNNKSFEEIQSEIKSISKKDDHLFVLNSNKENKLDIKVLRDLQSKLNLRTDNHRQICLIKDIDFVSIPCLNAFLKILEEPPKNVHFVLTTYKPAKVLETIKSRCFSFHYYGNKNPEIELDPISDILINKPGDYLVEEKNLEIDKITASQCIRNLLIYFENKFNYGDISAHSYSELIKRLNSYESMIESNVNPKSIFSSLVLQFLGNHDRINSK